MNTKYLRVIIVIIILSGMVITVLNYYHNVITPDSISDGQADDSVGHVNDFSNFTAIDLNGNSFSNADLAEDKINLINVWATFCKPCIEEMPDINELAEAYPDRLQVIGICFDIADCRGNVDDKLLVMARDIAYNITKVSYRILIPSVELLEGALSDVWSVPVTFIVDGHGKVLYSFSGAKDREELEHILGLKED